MSTAERPLRSEQTSSSLRAQSDPPPLQGGLHGLVIDHLGRQIASGELAAGQQILPEEVGGRLNVSRTVVREALRDLQAKGMVLPRPKTGTRVLGVESWNLLDEQVIGWRVRTSARQQQLRELMDLRSAVEVAAVRGSCRSATPEDVGRLTACCDSMAVALQHDDLHAFTEADIEFHTVLLLASGNLVFRRFIAPFAAVLRARDDLDLLPAPVQSSVVESHRELADAIAAGRPDRAVPVARGLIDHARAEMGLAP
ncbi:FCD domain-containing protein [Microlunatus panaciterrae]|uniref:DNA-binding FadR family transcriptional regulator n=1 Tax=Microlunatus panaciterrae TaxID=400768 RepID=A0ABS2RNZ3_9ACTN|nr:FCD domain-containing protein [Microlunatus panaciterrae]MBM7800388.1 DNA-binding FadR family transcriptional regulator [Microlunatus panaciterrae]